MQGNVEYRYYLIGIFGPSVPAATICQHPHQWAPLNHVVQEDSNELGSRYLAEASFR